MSDLEERINVKETLNFWSLNSSQVSHVLMSFLYFPSSSSDLLGIHRFCKVDLLADSPSGFTPDLTSGSSATYENNITAWNSTVRLEDSVDYEVMTGGAPDHSALCTARQIAKVLYFKFRIHTLCKWGEYFPLAMNNVCIHSSTCISSSFSCCVVVMSHIHKAKIYGCNFQY